MEEGKPRRLERSLVISLALLQPGHPSTPPLSRSLVRQGSGRAQRPLRSPAQILWKTAGRWRIAPGALGSGSKTLGFQLGQ